jgi:uncharacterized hydrophobic protein (TIGR00271 family)
MHDPLDNREGVLNKTMSTNDKQEPIKDDEVEETSAECAKEEEEKDESFTEMDLHPNTVDLDCMKNAVWFLFPDRNQRVSRFFLLISLAAVIATSGIAGDSPATVIGAMIVAPLMTPILGTMLAICLTDKNNFMFSFFLVLSGAGSCILIGYLYGLCLDEDNISAENNSQVAARVEPKLTDLIGALATGVVGALALVRKDIAGTLPGVAIAISLVPPLNVVGLTLSTGDGDDALGALLLFATNFTSILVMGIFVMYFYKVPMMGSTTRASSAERITAVVVLIILLGVVAIPLTLTSKRLHDENTIENCLTTRVNKWAEPFGWETNTVVATARPDDHTATILITGEPPFPESEEDFNEVIEECNVDEVTMRFIPQRVIEL